jgi:hypothetical protein
MEEDVRNIIDWSNKAGVTHFRVVDHKSLLSNPADNEFILILQKN